VPKKRAKPLFNQAYIDYSYYKLKLLDNQCFCSPAGGVGKHGALLRRRSVFMNNKICAIAYWPKN
jgi:hypothetical protein